MKFKINDTINYRPTGLKGIVKEVGVKDYKITWDGNGHVSINDIGFINLNCELVRQHNQWTGQKRT